jgi:hypothetical protein
MEMEPMFKLMQQGDFDGVVELLKMNVNNGDDDASEILWQFYDGAATGRIPLQINAEHVNNMNNLYSNCFQLYNDKVPKTMIYLGLLYSLKKCFGMTNRNINVQSGLHLIDKGTTIIKNEQVQTDPVMYFMIADMYFDMADDIGDETLVDLELQIRYYMKAKDYFSEANARASFLNDIDYAAKMEKMCIEMEKFINGKLKLANERERIIKTYNNLVEFLNNNG